jgi:hypothetical protein
MGVFGGIETSDPRCEVMLVAVILFVLGIFSRRA